MIVRNLSSQGSLLEGKSSVVNACNSAALIVCSDSSTHAAGFHDFLDVEIFVFHVLHLVCLVNLSVTQERRGTVGDQ